MQRRLAVGAIFIVIAGLMLLFYNGLGKDMRKLPSPLVGKMAPDFSLPDLLNPEETFTKDELLGQVTLVNVWASWCRTCRAERPYLTELAKTGVPIYSFNYRDTREEAIRYLNLTGNPFRKIGFDPNAVAGLEWGVYATPETYLIDVTGRIRYKHIGPLHPEIIRNQVLPMIKQLEAEANNG